MASEVRRTLLEILDERIEVQTATGRREVSKFRVVLENLVTNAVKGKPTSLNHLMPLMFKALEDREKAHRQVWIAEHMRNESESPDPARWADYKMVRVQMGYAKDKY